MSITSAEILGITSEPVILKTQEFDNSSSVEATFNVSISDSVSETATSTWSTCGTFTIGQKVSGFLGSSVGGETSLSYSQSWGIGGSESKTVTVGSKYKVVCLCLCLCRLLKDESSASKSFYRLLVMFT